jgi:hypothetical protein
LRDQISYVSKCYWTTASTARCTITEMPPPHRGSRPPMTRSKTRNESLPPLGAIRPSRPGESTSLRRRASSLGASVAMADISENESPTSSPTRREENGKRRKVRDAGLKRKKTRMDLVGTSLQHGEGPSGGDSGDIHAAPSTQRRTPTPVQVPSNATTIVSSPSLARILHSANTDLSLTPTPSFLDNDTQVTQAPRRATSESQFEPEIITISPSPPASPPPTTQMSSMYEPSDVTRTDIGDSRSSSPPPRPAEHVWSTMPSEPPQTKKSQPSSKGKHPKSVSVSFPTPSPSSSSSSASTSGSTSKPLQQQQPQQQPLSTYSCPICFCPPINATLTTCGHVACGACLFKAVKSSMARGMWRGGEDGEGLPKCVYISLSLLANSRWCADGMSRDPSRCPVCRAVIPGWDGKGGGVIGLKPRAVFTL